MIELERRRRIRLSVAAYAYEIGGTPILTDSEFDSLARSIDVNTSTGNEQMDAFFREHFDASTGMWIHKHPDLAGLERIAGSIVKGAADV